eukprot:g2534.t1
MQSQEEEEEEEAEALLLALADEADFESETKTDSTTNVSNDVTKPLTNNVSSSSTSSDVNKTFLLSLFEEEEPKKIPKIPKKGTKRKHANYDIVSSSSTHKNRHIDASASKAHATKKRKEDMFFYDDKTSESAKASSAQKWDVEIFSGLRVKNRFLSSFDLERRVRSRLFIRLPRLAIVKPPEESEGKDWLTIGVLGSKSAPKLTKKGQKKFAAWTLTDLSGCSISLFVHRNAYAVHWKMTKGKILAILNAKPLQSSSGTGERYARSLALSVTEASQIAQIGDAKDFGTCKAYRKDGKSCANCVNKSESEYCSYHLHVGFKKAANSRGFLSTAAATALGGRRSIGGSGSMRALGRQQQRRRRGVADSGVHVREHTHLSSGGNFKSHGISVNDSGRATYTLSRQEKGDRFRHELARNKSLVEAALDLKSTKPGRLSQGERNLQRLLKAGAFSTTGGGLKRSGYHYHHQTGSTSTTTSRRRGGGDRSLKCVGLVGNGAKKKKTSSSSAAEAGRGGTKKNVLTKALRAFDGKSSLRNEASESAKGKRTTTPSSRYTSRLPIPSNEHRAMGRIAIAAPTTESTDEAFERREKEKKKRKRAKAIAMIQAKLRGAGGSKLRIASGGVAGKKKKENRRTNHGGASSSFLDTFGGLQDKVARDKVRGAQSSHSNAATAEHIHEVLRSHSAKSTRRNELSKIKVIKVTATTCYDCKYTREGSKPHEYCVEHEHAYKVRKNVEKRFFACRKCERRTSVLDRKTLPRSFRCSGRNCDASAFNFREAGLVAEDSSQAGRGQKMMVKRKEIRSLRAVS